MKSSLSFMSERGYIISFENTICWCTVLSSRNHILLKSIHWGDQKIPRIFFSWLCFYIINFVKNNFHQHHPFYMPQGSFSFLLNTIWLVSSVTFLRWSMLEGWLIYTMQSENQQNRPSRVGLIWAEVIQTLMGDKKL